MAERTVWGLLGAVALLGVIWAGGIWFTLAIGFLTVLGLLEYAELLKKLNLEPRTEAMLLISLLLFAFIYIVTYHPWVGQTDSLSGCERILAFGFFVTVIVMLLYELFRGEPERGLINAAANLFGTVYIGFMFAYILMVRLMGGGDGLFYVLFTFLVTWFNDTAAYFIGTAVGKHKLSPRISPNKSIEGSIGGLLGGAIGSLLLAFIYHKPAMFLVVLGTLVVIAGQIGDLAESLIKRNAGVKDSGSFLPGHGGLLDRFDSVLLSAPVVYYCIIFIAPHL